MLATAENMHHSPTQGSKTPEGTNTPRLNKYRVRLHFREIMCAGQVIPKGTSTEIVWGASPLDAIIHTVDRYRDPEMVLVWAEVVKWCPVKVYFPADFLLPAEVLGSTMIAKTNTRVQITMPKSLAEQLREQAEQEGKTVSEIVVKKIMPGEPAKEEKKMNIDLNKICDCGAELHFDSTIDGNEREYMQTGEHLHKTVCPNCGERWQFRESDIVD